MKRRTFLRNSVVGVGGIAGMACPAMETGVGRLSAETLAANPGGASEVSDVMGRPVRVTSISFPNGLSVEQIAELVDKAGAAGADVIALPELCRGQDEKSHEDLHGPTITAMSALARKHHTYIACPIDRAVESQRFNTVVLLDRRGEVVATYDKIFPYWGEYNAHPTTSVGDEAEVHHADFGAIGFATCFDVNFPEVWKRLADLGAELVIWPSAYSAGRSLQAHALNHHYYIVSSTQMSDCFVYDITGEEMLHEKSDEVNVTRVALDLDRGIYHINFNDGPRDKMLKERPEDIVQEKWLEDEQWFVLKAKRQGVSARALAKQYGLEELRHYLDRSRRAIDDRRGWEYQAKVLFPNLDTASLKELSLKAKLPASTKANG
jgi:predicted amidohydrolase